MTVYVDKCRISYRRMKMCHMLADTVEELHTMVDAIGVSRKWFQNKSIPHYDICMSKRKLAIENGAVETNRYKIVELIKTHRRIIDESKIHR